MNLYRLKDHKGWVFTQESSGAFVCLGTDENCEGKTLPELGQMALEAFAVAQYHALRKTSKTVTH
jgi:hypothetical protein